MDGYGINSTASLRTLQAMNPGKPKDENTTPSAFQQLQNQHLQVIKQPLPDGSANILSKYQADSGSLYNTHVHGL